MNCQKCGSPLVPGDKFCKTCGTAVQQEQPMMNQMPTGMDNQMNNQPENNAQHPLMMNQADLNVNAMSTNNNMNTMDNNQNNMGMGNNQFVPNDQPMMNNNQPMMNNNMSMMNNGMNQMNNSVPQPMSIPGNNMGMNQPMTGPMGAMTPKNNNSKFIIGGVILAIVVIAAILVFGGSGSSLGGGSVGKGGEEEKNVPTYSVKISGFSFQVPQTYIYEASNGYLLLTDESDSWILRLSVQKASYENLKSNKEQLKPTAEKQGYNAEAAVVKTFNGVEMIKFNFEASGMKYNGAYAKLNSMYLATIEGFNADNSYDESLLKRAASVIKTAEYVGETANMEIAIPDGAITLIGQ